MTSTTLIKEQKLSSQQREFISIAALTTTGKIPQLTIAYNKALDAGLTINEIKEEVVQLYAYCGFPRSLNALNELMAVLENRKKKGLLEKVGTTSTEVKDDNKYQTGKKTLAKLIGKEEKALTGVNAFAPEIDVFLKEHLFADIFSRDGLSYQQRELATVSALAAMDGVASQLQAHITMALHIGILESQLRQAFHIIGEEIGKVQEDLAIDVLNKVAKS